MIHLLHKITVVSKKIFCKEKHEKQDFVYVVGNSHTRAFSFNSNFFPMFLGSGKTHSLIDDNGLENLKISLTIALKNISNQKVMIVLGEPDTRYYLGKGWYPWENEKQFEVDDYRPLVHSSLKRYKQLIDFLKSKFDNTYIILNVTPVLDSNQNEIVNYFNGLLSKYCMSENIIFIDINKDLYQSDKHINTIYLGDAVHLNNKIQPFVEKTLISMSLLKSSNYENTNWNHLKVQGKYKYSKKFGCYIIQE